jgi:hypothetical protein
MRPATEKVRMSPESTPDRPGALIILSAAACARAMAPRPARSSRFEAIPATITASAAPSHMVKPSRCRKSHNRIMR